MSDITDKKGEINKPIPSPKSLGASRQARGEHAGGALPVGVGAVRLPPLQGVARAGKAAGTPCPQRPWGSLWCGEVWRRRMLHSIRSFESE